MRKKILISKELRKTIDREWFEQKVMALDFRGLDRAKILDKWEQLFPNSGKPNPMVLYMGGFDGKKHHIIADIDSAWDKQEFDDWGSVYSKAELLEEIERILTKNPSADFNITLVDKELELTDGRMDTTGKQTSRGTIKVRNGDLDTSEEEL